MDELEPQKSGVSRRTVTKAMAWAVPVIAIAAPAPAFALSGEPPSVCAGEPYKVPGNSGCKAFSTGGTEVDVAKGFGFPLLVTNDTDQPIYIGEDIVVTILYSEGGVPVLKVFPIVSSVPALPAELQPGESVILFTYFNEENSGGFTGRVRIVVPWGHPPAPDPSNHPDVVLEFCVTSNQWHPITSDQCTPVTDLIAGGCSTDAPPPIGSCRGED
jgi:hypothetical protein